MLEIHVAQTSDIVGKHVRYVTTLVGARVQVLNFSIVTEYSLDWEVSREFMGHPYLLHGRSHAKVWSSRF
mgnify:CR=1 FL=1